MRGGLSRVNVAALALGLAFLYLPIVILVVYSFNDSRLVTVWGGWSLRWYRALLDNEAMLWNSTHRDVHPQPATYDEIWQKTVDYASAIKSEDHRSRLASGTIGTSPRPSR